MIKFFESDDLVIYNPDPDDHNQKQFKRYGCVPDGAPVVLLARVADTVWEEAKMTEPLYLLTIFGDSRPWVARHHELCSFSFAWTLLTCSLTPMV